MRLHIFIYSMAGPFKFLKIKIFFLLELNWCISFLIYTNFISPEISTNIVMADFAFIQSQKGKVQLKTRDGFCYVKEKQVNDKTYWRCTAYTTKLRCHARIHTLQYDIVRQTSHNHLPIANRNVDKVVITEFVDIKPDHKHTVFKIWFNLLSMKMELVFK